MEDTPDIKKQEAKNHYKTVKDILDEISPGFNPDYLFIPRLTGFKQISGLFIINLDTETFDQRIIKQANGASRLKKYNFDGTQYQSILVKENFELAFFQYRNLLIVSTFPRLVEESISQLNNYRTSITHEAGFKVLAIDNQYSSGPILHIRFDKINDFIKSFINPDYRKFLEALPHFSKWLAINFSSLSGQHFGSQSLSENKVVENTFQSDILTIVPDNIGLLYSDEGEIFSSPGDSIYIQYTQTWADDEYAFAIMNPRSSIDPLLIIRAEDIEFAKHYLIEYGEDFGLLSAHSFLTYEIYQVLGNDFLSPYLKCFPSLSKNPFFVIINDFVVFGNSRQNIEAVINKFLVGQSILNDSEFVTFNSSLSSETTSYIYFDEKGFNNILNELFVSKRKGETSLLQEGKFPSGISFSNQKDKANFKVVLKEKKRDKSNKAEIVWRTALSAPIEMAPQIIWNKLEQEHQILIQDKSNFLYLLNDTGEVLWKRQLGATLLSEVFLVEAIDVTTFHLLFNTAEKIFLFDHKGNSVGNYPIHLQSKATNGLCKTDIYHDNNYQYYVACENGYAYGFSKDGNPIPGWNPLKHIGNTSKTIQHFQHDGQDYFIIMNDLGELAVYNSLGQPVFEKVKAGPSFYSVPAILEVEKEKLIALNNESGQVKLINTKGRSFDLQMGKGRSGKINMTFANITGSHQSEYILYGENKASVFQHKERFNDPLFEFTLFDSPDSLFALPLAESDYSFLGTLEKAENQIHLYNSSGQSLPGFPIAGSTVFSLIDLFNNNDLILVVGFENSVYSYRINK